MFIQSTDQQESVYTYDGGLMKKQPGIKGFGPDLIGFTTNATMVTIVYNQTMVRSDHHLRERI